MWKLIDTDMDVCWRVQEGALASPSPGKIGVLTFFVENSILLMCFSGKKYVFANPMDDFCPLVEKSLWRPMDTTDT